ncbi:Protein of unknown function [Cotesia congregata]|uniref:Uncharacterized protein n=1 Tax=Cotesia congregata TaxID=51543 RepID=A0A8J2HIS1_COTCN|nr:Protein of unknown function [Cotesia congregata]
MDILDSHLDPQDVSGNPKDENETTYDPLSGDGVPDDGLRYQEALAYRVVQVNGNSVSNEIELPVQQHGNNSVQVLTSPINGQFYIVGGTNEVFTTSQTSRSLAPRTTTLQIETPRNNTPGKIIPDCSNNSGTSNGNGSSTNQGLGQCLRDNEKLRQEVTALKQHVQRLQRENDQLRKVNVVVSNIN